jgi:hypothetical protein
MLKTFRVLPLAALAIIFLVSISCRDAPILLRKNGTIILAGAYNTNGKCIGHAGGLCGLEKENLTIEIEGVFATEPDCTGLRLRRFDEKRDNRKLYELPLALSVYYEGTHIQPYMGTGQGENVGWRYDFNGPNGYFSANARTEHELAKRVCSVAKGSGAQIVSQE